MVKADLFKKKKNHAKNIPLVRRTFRSYETVRGTVAVIFPWVLIYETAKIAAITVIFRECYSIQSSATTIFPSKFFRSYAKTFRLYATHSARTKRWKNAVIVIFRECYSIQSSANLFFRQNSSVHCVIFRSYAKHSTCTQNIPLVRNGKDRRYYCNFSVSDIRYNLQQIHFFPSKINLPCIVFERRLFSDAPARKKQVTFTNVHCYCEKEKPPRSVTDILPQF